MKVLSTTSLTKLIELIKSSFLSVNNVVTTQTISCPADSEVVHNTGDETIAGIKTFSSSPVLPTPASSDNSTSAATTAFVKAQGYATSDTKNTAGSTNTNSKIYLVGATSQAANPQTYSHDTAFVDTAGCLNSDTPAVNNNSTKVATTAYIETKFKVVSALPAFPDSNTYYFIPES